MQIIFKAGTSVKAFAEAREDFDFPPFEQCLNAGCKYRGVHKHGFYWRYCFDGWTCWYIPIRRYYCPRCKLTFSFLPDFCLPGFQYTCQIIFQCLVERFCNMLSLRAIQKKLFKGFQRYSLTRISCYIKRFTENLPWIETVLRASLPRCYLGSPNESEIKRAKKALDIIATGFDQILSFAKLFHEQCHRSFLAPITNLV